VHHDISDLTSHLNYWNVEYATRGRKVVGNGALNPYEFTKITDEIGENLRAWIEPGKKLLDWGCFTGDTKISLLNGTAVPIKDLVGLKEFWVYSCTPEGKIVPGHAHSARVTHTNAELVEVTLDNNETIKCTPNHLFMMRDGTYKEARDLKKDDSLMPLYRRVSTEEDDSGRVGYEMVLDNSNSSEYYTHALYRDLPAACYDRRRKVLVFCEKTTKHIVRHHIDFNKRDNDPSNLVWMTWKDHFYLHGDNAVMNLGDYWRLETSRTQAIKNITLYNESPEFEVQRLKDRKRNGDRSKKRLITYNRSDAGRRNSSKSGKINGPKALTKYNKSETGRGRSRALCNTRVKCRVCDMEYGNIGALGMHMKSAHFEVWSNHKIVSVISTPTREDVYDITVDKYHNFALTAGVFVHNCGVGRFYPYLFDKCEEYVGLDINRAALNVAAFCYPDIHFHQISPIGDWSIPSRTVDRFLSVFVLQHLTIPEVLNSFTKNFYRVCMKGCRVYIIENVHEKENLSYIHYRTPEQYITMLSLENVVYETVLYSGEKHVRLTGSVSC